MITIEFEYFELQSYNQCVFYKAIQRNDVLFIKGMLKCKSMELRSINYKFWKPMDTAAYHGSLETFKFLKNCGSDSMERQQGTTYCVQVSICGDKTNALS